MGNFLSNQRRETMDNKYTEDGGVMVKLILEKDYSKKTNHNPRYRIYSYLG